MPDDRTLVTELVTALGMTGHRDFGEAAAARPPVLNVGADVWDRLERVLTGGDLDRLARTAFDNGAFFASHPDGLGGCPPRRIEWSGGRRIPGDLPIPADLLIDSVYMISCKYLSEILLNTAPARIFDDVLAPPDSLKHPDWYQMVAPAAHKALYRRTVETLGLVDMPDAPEELAAAHRIRLKDAIREHQQQHGDRGLPAEARSEYRTLINRVSRESELRWRAALRRLTQPELMLWRLLRVCSAAYFILGVDSQRTMRLRVMTPWEWRRRYELVSFDVSAAGRGQPRVDWTAVYRRRSGAAVSRCRVSGHVEIRWSHGPYMVAPEAKVYLDTPHRLVPGYQPLDGVNGGKGSGRADGWERNARDDPAGRPCGHGVCDHDPPCDSSQLRLL